MIATADSKLPITCGVCDRTLRVNPTSAGNPRPPVGWSNLGTDGYICGECWGKKYVARAVVIPITTDDWEGLRAALKPAFVAARSIANWAYSELLKTEPPRDPAATKLAKREYPYLYGLRATCPAWSFLPATSAGAVLSDAEKQYKADRFDLIWFGSRSARNYRDPYPIPFTAAGWRLVRDDEEYHASIPLVGGRVTVKLITDKHAAKILDTLIGSDLLRGSCKLVEQRHFGASGKNGRNPGNGARFQSRLKLMISYYQPVEKREIDGEMIVKTQADSLLTAVVDGQRIWTYNADHAKNICERHARYMSRLVRLSDDRKFETRRPRREAKPRLAAYQRDSDKDHDRLRSLLHEVSAHVVNFATRRRVARMVWDDTCHSFCESFPWAMLRTMVEQKARAKGIEVISRGSDPAKSREPLATEKVQ